MLTQLYPTIAITIMSSTQIWTCEIGKNKLCDFLQQNRYFEKLTQNQFPLLSQSNY